MKKAQITVFIILGLLLVIGVSIYLYMTQSAVQKGLPPSVLEAPVEIRPVVQYITDCLAEAGEGAIIRIGAGGGYIDVKSRGARVNQIDPTEGDALQFAPGSNLTIPYWWYLKSPNNCVGACEFGSMKPPLLRESGQNSIENQLDEAVAEAVRECTINFTSLSRQGFAIIPEGKPMVTTTIGTTGVTFLLDYPLSITREGQEFRQQNYGTHVSVQLTEMYSMASELAQLEANPKYTYLERHMQQVIDSFTGLQDGGLPPVAYATFDLDNGKRWVKEDVHRQVRSLITTYVPMLQVWGAKNQILLEAPADAEYPDLWNRLYNLNMLIPLKDNHPQFEVRFASPDWWREHFNLNCRGQICAPDSMVNTYGFPFGFQKYNFAYSYSVPVLIEIRDPTAFANKGFVFQYAMEANVRDNEPFTILGYENPWDEFTKDFSPVAPGASMICDMEQRTGSTVTVNVVDAAGKPVDAAISFACGEENCAIGPTKGGTLTTKFPRCAGGDISAVVAERYGQSVPVNTHDEDTKTVTVVSYPITELRADFDRVQYVKTAGGWIFNPTRVDKLRGDQIVVMMARDGRQGDQPYAASVEMCGTPGDNTLGVARLVPGNYTVSTISMYHEKLAFLPQKRCVDSFCYTIPDKEMSFGKEGATCASGNPMLLGSSEFHWEVTPEMLASGNTLMFKSLVAAIDQVPEATREIEDMDIISELQDASVAYQQYLLPEVVRR